jgi:tetratricopeptide (TPR) repeat protein/predicted Ser/Thr protein kinase
VVRELFCELADTSPEERERILAERQLPPELRAELEWLLQHDSGLEASLDRCVSGVAAAVLRSDARLTPGDCGPYRLIRLLGKGGMGAVYLAERRDGEIEQKVAIKLLRADSDLPTWRDRFLKERQLLAYLNHPSIARLLDAGHTDDGRPYLVMEHIDGVAIDEFARTLDLRARLRLFLPVCAAVSHAHQRLIIHRDLKPSNILVDSSGHPKLLDFGIAKLLDVTGDNTRTVERALTPGYASPEQLTGGVQTTATDIYLLGGVLWKLLTGHAPRETPGRAVEKKLPRDIRHVLRKALRDEPDERYSSVDAFADDIRAFLDFRPVQARSGDAWYRARRLLRRHWIPASAAAITIAGLSLGLFVANRERALAQERFQQVRQLANRVLALDEAVGALPGSTKARHEIVAMSKEYLEALAPKARGDLQLALETGIAYAQLARAQGVPGTQNLAQYAQAEESLLKAQTLIEPVLAAQPHNRRALLTLAGISQGLMILAMTTGHRQEEAVAQSLKAASRLDELFTIGAPSQPEIREAARIFHNIAQAYRNMHRHDVAVVYVRKATQLARSLPTTDDTLANALTLLADFTRISGDLEGAMQAIQEAKALLEATKSDSIRRSQNSRFMALWREGVIFSGGNGPSLNRPAEATAAFQQAFDLVEKASESDPHDASMRILFDQAGRELGAILRDRDPARALAVYDKAILHLREIPNNRRARSGEAGMLSGSSYALRRLGRVTEAKSRIDEAFRLLREIEEYPADAIDTDSEAEPALRALADYYYAARQPIRAAEVYQELLDKVLASKPDPENDLRQAAKLSRIYEALTVLHRRNGRPDRAADVFTLRRSLWQHWDRKLPNNSYIRRQLQAASAA